MSIIAARNGPLSHSVAELNWQSNRTRLSISSSRYSIVRSRINRNTLKHLEICGIGQEQYIYIENHAWCTTRWARSRSSNYSPSIMILLTHELFMRIVLCSCRGDIPMEPLKVKVSNSLKSLLMRLRKQEVTETNEKTTQEMDSQRSKIA